MLTLIKKLFSGKHVTISPDQTTTTIEYAAGIKNSEIELNPQSESGLVKALIKADNKNKMTQLIVSYKRIYNKKEHSRNAQFLLKKNEANVINVQTNLAGNLKDIRETPSEIPKQSMVAYLNIKILDYTATIDAKLNLESSIKKGQHACSFELKTDNLFKTLIKVASIKSSVQVNTAQNKITAEYEMQKIGEVKSWKLKSTNGQLRKTGDNKEFDISYEKNLANGNKLTGTGTVKYVFENLKNFKASGNVKDAFNFNISVDNDRDAPSAAFGTHELYMNYAHLDATKEERELKLSINNKTEKQFNKFVFKFVSKKGTPGQLSNIDGLSYLVDINTDNSFMEKTPTERILLEGKNSIAAKLKQFNIDLGLKNTIKFDIRAKTLALTVDCDTKFPAIVSDPGKLNFLENKYAYNFDLTNQKRTLSNKFKTDNKLIGKLLKEFKLDYTRQTSGIGSNKTNIINANLDITTPDSQLKNLKVDIERVNCQINDDSDLCSGTKLKLKQNILPQYVFAERG